MNAAIGRSALTTSAMRAAADAFVEAFAAGDLDALVGCFASDAMLKLGDQPLASGSSEIRSLWRCVIDGGTARAFELHPAETVSIGDSDRPREMGVYVLDQVSEGAVELVEETYTIVWNLGRSGAVEIAMARFDEPSRGSATRP